MFQWYEWFFFLLFCRCRKMWNEKKFKWKGKRKIRWKLENNDDKNLKKIDDLYIWYKTHTFTHILLHICILITCVIFIKQTDLSIRICISHWILTNKYWLRSIYNMYCICNKQQVTVTRHLYIQIYRHLYLIATHPSIHRWDVK